MAEGSEKKTEEVVSQDTTSNVEPDTPKEKKATKKVKTKMVFRKGSQVATHPSFSPVHVDSLTKKKLKQLELYDKRHSTNWCKLVLIEVEVDE